ncbi:hypothetical protein NPIL_457651 [Nephila pilipes]|uniref:Uncharacterized protein n=1 Tax=Nephila pilipes TaxID=299642 RepID=A0A8X6THF5_NEPPI|nr:hypothetical protein NPIL_457651 [Nephila pilipes]
MLRKLSNNRRQPLTSHANPPPNQRSGLIPGAVIASQNTNPPPVLEGSSGPSNRRLEEEAMGRGRRRLLPDGDLLSPREHKSYFGAIDLHFGSRRTIFFVRYIASR